jgi:RNA polymerase sigma factor (sigma-70 family)
MSVRKDRSEGNAMREGTRPGTGPADVSGAAGNATARAAVVPVDPAAVARVGARYAELYRTRNHRLVTYATSLTGSAPDAEDLVAEAHFRVWRRLRAGHEVDSVPAYLTTTVRGLASSLGRAQHEIAHDWRELPQDAESLTASLAKAGAGAAGSPKPAHCASRVALLTRLLTQLPDRWANALWYAEVEDLPAEAVGARIGASASTASAELARARERLREAYLRGQGGAPALDACADHWELMPAIVRGTASARKSRRIAQHTNECTDCRTRLVLLTEANSRLPLILGPALLTRALNALTASTGSLVPAAAGTVATTATTTTTATTATTRALANADTAATADIPAAATGRGRHARVKPRTVARPRAQVFTRTLGPAKGLLVGTAGVVGVAAAATAIALGATNPHQASTANAVAAPPAASPGVPGVPGTGGAPTAGGTGAGLGTAGAAGSPFGPSSNPASAPGSALTSAATLQSTSAPSGPLTAPGVTSTAAPGTTAAPATSAPATTPATAAPSTSPATGTPATTSTPSTGTSTTPPAGTSPTTSPTTSPSTPATTSAPPATTTPTTSAPTSSPTAPAGTPTTTPTGTPEATDTATTAPPATDTTTATPTPAATDPATTDPAAATGS